MSLPPKKKVCKKGTSKAKGFKGCNEFKYIHRYGLCSSCFGEWLYSSGEGEKLLNGALNKAQKPRIELEAAIKENKDRKSLGALKQQTQKLVNKYVRMRDNGLNCISQNTPYQLDFDAGHCFPVSSHEGLRFDLDNINGQSIGANRFKEGDHINYMLNLPKRIGQERFESLVQRAKNYKMFGNKFSREELIDIQENIKKLISELN